MKAKVGFEKRLARNVKANPKAFHSYVRSKQKAKDIVGPLVGNDGTIVSSSKDMADLLNNYFASVFTVDFFVWSRPYIACFVCLYDSYSAKSFFINYLFTLTDQILLIVKRVNFYYKFVHVSDLGIIIPHLTKEK